MSGIGEAVLTATLEPMIQQMSSEAFKFLTNRKRVKSSLEKLSRELGFINGVVKDAEEKQYSEEAIKMWLSELRDAAYDLEDLLDDIKTKAEMEKHRSRNEVYKLFNFSPFTLIFNYKMMSKIQGITVRLQDIRNRANALNLRSERSGDSGYENGNHATASATKPHMVQDDFVVGIDKRKEKIINMILDSNDDDVLVVPIIGMGGIGKTTLAKAVYYDTKVKQHFDVMAIACVSIGFNELEITQKIYHDVTEKEPGSLHLVRLQGKLHRELVNKKFLIVLDDVWNESSEKWENLIYPFKKGRSGSIMIVTTRSEEIAKKVNPHFKPVRLEPLNEEDCLSLMLHHAQISFKDKPEFEIVGMELMRKCKGLPMAARVLGGILVSKHTVKEWEMVLANNIWKLEGENIMSVLSYFDLPPHLKRMFVYCSIFPQDHVFVKRDIVLLWMGEGFLDQHKDTDMQTKEEWGHQCFDELVKKSFFLYADDDAIFRIRDFKYDDLQEFYVMHDLANDLACLVASETCVNWNRESSLQKARHCSIFSEQQAWSRDYKAFSNADRLRTLLLQLQEGYCPLTMPSKILRDLLSKLRHIRVLSLSNCDIEQLPNSICELTHLRYLDLSRNCIRTLPNSLGRLIWLETLSIRGCDEIRSLPESLANLCHLRHLDIRKTYNVNIPREFGKLEYLQTLSTVDLNKDGGFGVKELRNLKHLAGSLTIAGLENIISKEDGVECLKLKKNLHDLCLISNGVSKSDEISQECVLECLRPHENLRRLKIFLHGSRLPSWVGDHSYAALSDMFISGCTGLLPPLGQLPNLKKLVIKRMDSVTCIGDEFYGHSFRNIPFSSLESLSFEDMQNLTKWCKWSKGGTSEGHVFSHLKELKIQDCQKLVDVHPLFSEYLQKLTLQSCSGVLLNSFHALSSLIYFRLYCISGLCYLPHELVQSFSSLEALYINNCQELEMLWPEDTTLEHITHLETINIRDCRRLQSLGLGNKHFPCKLRDLTLSSCPALVSHRTNVHPLFSHLVTLEIDGCDTIEHFPSLPSGLKYLKISSCEALRSLPSDISYSSMESLKIRFCSRLDNFPSFDFPPKLSSLSVTNCEELRPLYEWGLHRLLNLRSFSIQGEFPELHQLNDTYLFPTSLNKLCIKGFPMLVSLGNAFENLKELRHLEIWFCNNLVTLPSEGVLENLHILYILQSPGVKIEHGKDVEGYLKNKIGIPEVSVSWRPLT